MPTYTYKCINTECAYPNHTVEIRGVPISERNNQVCTYCNAELKRRHVFNGSVWAPTAGGMR